MSSYSDRGKENGNDTALNSRADGSFLQMHTLTTYMLKSLHLSRKYLNTFQSGKMVMPAAAFCSRPQAEMLLASMVIKLLKRIVMF